MSTHDLNVKLTRPSVVNSSSSSSSSVGRTPLEQPSADSERGGIRNDPKLIGISTESPQIQTTKNLYIRRRILLKTKGDWGSTTRDQREGPDQLQFTSFFSLRLNSTKRSDKNRTDTETQLSSNDLHRNHDAVRRPANVQDPKLCKKASLLNRESTEKAAKDENLSKPPFRKGCTTYPQQDQNEHDIPSHRPQEGIQCGLASCDQAQTAKYCSQRQLPGSDHLTQQPVTESKSAVRESEVNDPFRENAEGVLCHSNLIPFGEDSGSKASTNCQPSACSPRALKRALSLPSFPASHRSCKLETEPSRVSPSTAMFTSTIVSVLAPHWSGRFRRHKRDAGEVEQDIQVSGQNCSQSASSQTTAQHAFLLTQMRASGETLDRFNNKLREPAGTSRSSAEWQKDASSLHFTATRHTKRTLLQPISLETNQHTVDVEYEKPVPLPLDTSQGHRSTLSLQVSGYKRVSLPEDQGEDFSPPTSRPTTSSLLLSWRRLNSRIANAECTEMEKQLATSVSSLTLPNKGKLRLSQPHSPLVSPDDPMKEIFQPYAFPASSERLQGPEKSPVSPRVRKIRTSRRSMFLINREFDVSSRPASATNDTTKEGLYSSSPTGSSQPETLNAPQCHSKEILERKCSNLGHNASVEQNITDYTNSNINRLNRTYDFSNTCISPKDNLNNNIGNSVFGNSYHISDTMIKKHIGNSQPTERSTSLSTHRQSNSTYDLINSNKVNTVETTSTSKSTRTIQTTAASPSAGLTSMSLTQTGQNSNQNSIINTRGPENLSPSRTNSVSGRTFTDSLVFTPRKEPSAVETTSPSHVWQNYLNLRQSQSNQSPSDETSPLSSARPLRRVHAPSIYSYLRETSPPLTTQTPSALSSPSPQTPSLKQDGTQIKNNSAVTSRFTFDLGQEESRDVVWTQDSCPSSVPQSLPPDFGRRSAPRLSKSPYSTLISARPALSTLHNPSSTPRSHQHSNLASYDSSAIIAIPPKVEKDSYPSVQKDNWIQGTPKESVSSSDKRLAGGTAQIFCVSRDTCSSSNAQSSPNARFTNSQTTNLIPDTTLPKSGTVNKNTGHEEPDGTFSSPSDKGNTYATQGLNDEQHSSPLSPLTTGKAMPAIMQKEVTTLQTRKTLQGIQRSDSKKSLFSRSNKDIQASASSAGKEGLKNQDNKRYDREVTGLKNSNKMDQVLNRLKVKFGVKRSEDDLTTRRKTKNFSQQSLDLKAPECKKKEVNQQTSKSPDSSSSQITTVQESYHSSDPLSGFTNKKCKNLPNVEKHKRLADENGNQFLGRPQSPNWPKPHYINRYATMPQTRKPTLSPSPTLYPSAFSAKDTQTDDVFYSHFPLRRKNTFACQTENVPPHPGHSANSQRQRLMGAHLSASCADLKYGLERGRSVSVSSIVSGRPSGPGRISTGSKGSVSDLSSLDEFSSRSRHSSISISPEDSPEYGVKGPSSLPVHNTYKGCVQGRLPSNDRLWSPVSLDTSPYARDTEADPTPPPSPPFSPTSRRISRVPSSSSTGSRTSQDSLSPRGFLPSRNYKCTLSVFEESSSDTTTDDEYYLNSDLDEEEEKETEL
ncbi:uncharacterized protein [Salminus brasiliensis]|uniref:uncharacterized protein n=1 Tax=Salminus brasiliensis TaxID=930266 RepID=UPI003B8355F0